MSSSKTCITVLSLLFFNGALAYYENPELNYTQPLQKKQFYLVSTHTDFIEAEHYCMARGDKLARLLTREENEQALQLIQSELPKTDTYVWLGGYCPGLGQPNYWLNPRTLMDFSYFHPGEPNSWAFDRCLQFWKIGETWKWNDDNCWYKRPFMCEKTGQSGSGQNNTSGWY